MKNNRAESQFLHWLNGLTLVLLVSFSSYYFASLPFFANLHLSPLILSVLVGILASFLFKNAEETCAKAVAFSAKRLLRIGIILYGFNLTLENIVSVGWEGIILSLVIVVGILSVGYWIGVKLLKLDKEIAILVSAGSAICGAAAILALESSLKSQPYKGIVAVGTVVVFGLLGMFLYPLVYALGWIPLNPIQEGYLIGLTLHELANVVGAAGAIGEETQEVALIVKMIRVLLLVAVLLVIPYFFSESKEGEKRKLQIPWFALCFLAVVVFNSLVSLPNGVVLFFKFFSSFFLVMAMSALGLQVDLKKFLEFGGKAFVLALILFVILALGGFFLVDFWIS